MAFTSTIKPYKFVNPSSISSKGGGATIIAGGKTITGGVTPQVKSARVTMLAINRIGMAMEGLGKTQQQIRDIIVYENKYLAQSTAFRKRREGYRRDQKSEAQSESFGKKEKDGVAKEVEKKEKKNLGWLEKIFGPFAGIISFVGRIVITQTVLRWMGDPKNTDKLSRFVKSFSTVFKWAFNIAYKSTDAVLTGFSKVFGSSDKKGLDRFGEVLGGLGQLLIGIAGFKALGYLLNPFSLVNDIIGLVDMLSAGSGKSGGGPGAGGGPEKPQLGKGAQKVAENYGDDAARYYDDLVKRGKKPGDALKAVRGRFKKLPPAPKTLAGKMKQGFMTQVDSLKKFGGKIKGFGIKAFNIGAGVFKKGKELVGQTGNWIKASGKQLKTLAAAAKDPEMLKHLVNKTVAEKVKPAIEKNPGVKKLLQIISDPKNIGKNIGPVIKDALKSKQALDTVKYLKDVQKNAKIGGLDKVIAALTALFDYGVMGTPFANAFLGAIGGLLGYSGGFALGAPFGGIPGFIAGAAGGIAGEAIGRGLARMLGKGALGKIQDPLMNDGRMLADPELAVGGIVDKPTRAILGEKGPEAVVPLSKLSGGGAVAATIIGATYSALSRMGAAGEIAKTLIGSDLASAENMFGAAKVSAGGGDSLGKSVMKASKGMEEIDAGNNISIFLGKENVVIKDRKEPSNKATTLRGQLANILSALIWVSKKDLKGGTSPGPGPGPGPGPTNLDLKGNTNAEKVFRHLVDKEGFTPEAAAGIIGNLMQESGVNPKSRQLGGGPGRGIMQWTESERWASMKAWAGNKDPWALDTQIQWMVKEMKDYGTYNRIKGVKDYKKAVEIFESEMEKAGTPNYPARYSYAASAYSSFGGQKMASGGAVAEWNKRHAPKGQQSILTASYKEARQPSESWGKFASGGKFSNGQLPENELVSIGSGHKLHKSVASQFKAMMDAAKKDGYPLGSAFKINSSYRSYQRQKELYASLGPGTAAFPGTSNHGLGLAVDLWYTDGAYKWLRKNANIFGFRQIPGYETDNPNAHEAWHWENVSGKGSIDGGSPTSPAGGGPGGGDTQQEKPETMETLMAKLKSAVSGLNTSLGYSSPTEDKTAKPGQTPPAPNTPSPSTSKSVPAAVAAASATAKQVTNISDQVARLEEAAKDAGNYGQIVPLPINSGTTQIAYGGGTQVYTPKTPITYGI